MGTRNQPFLGAGVWQVQMSYQYGFTDQMFVGSQRNDAAGPFGQPVQRRSNITTLDVAYGVRNRLSLGVTVPLVAGSGALQEGTPDAHRLYGYHADGIGDISVQAEYWLADPARSSRVRASIGFGLQAPTGSNTVKGPTFSSGSDQNLPIDDAWQPGNGGWYALLRAQSTVRFNNRVSGYVSGFYGMSLDKHTNVTEFETLVGVPDTYSGRFGAAYALPVFDGTGHSLVVSLGGLVNGTTVRDVVGGGDLFFRRAGYEFFVSPAVTWNFGQNMVNITVPIRVHQRQIDSLWERSQGFSLGQDFVPWFLQAAYSRRF